MTMYDEFESTSADNQPAPCKSAEQVLYSKDSLSAFKANQAWPGQNYFLLGESHTIEKRTIDTMSATRRAACINHLLLRGRNNQHCVSVGEALTVSGFVSCLSRVEYEWLKKQPSSALIGPSYNQDGKLVAESFAVWRREDICKAAGRAYNSFRSFRTSRNAMASRHES